jgi:hypothetical protein
MEIKRKGRGSLKEVEKSIFSWTKREKEGHEYDFIAFSERALLLCG